MMECKRSGKRSINVIIAGQQYQFFCHKKGIIDDKRNKLYLAIIEIVKQYKPKTFIIEKK